MCMRVYDWECWQWLKSQRPMIEGQQRLRPPVSGPGWVSGLFTPVLVPPPPACPALKRGFETDRTSSLLAFPSLLLPGLNWCVFLFKASTWGSELLGLRCKHRLRRFYLLCFSILFSFYLHHFSFIFLSGHYFHCHCLLEDRHSWITFNQLYSGERVHSAAFNILEKGHWFLLSHIRRENPSCAH